MSRPMKKCRRTGSDHAPSHDSVTMRPSLWMKRVSKFRVCLSAPRGPHFVAGVVEIVAVDEFDRVEADHLLGRVSQDGLRARADLDQHALGIGDQDQILRGLEDAPPFLDLRLSASRVFLASVMSRAILDAPMIAPDGALIGEMLSETGPASVAGATARFRDARPARRGRSGPARRASPAAVRAER